MPTGSPRPERGRPGARSGAFALLLAVAACAAALAREALPLASFARERISIATRGARLLSFTAWRADDDLQRQQGLMFVREMRPEQAMIFVYEPAQPVGMWMKNTYIPLDMLFVDERGCVVSMAENAEPQSLATIGSGYPVVLVVELNAGTVRTARIAIGDRVLRPDAGWPAGGVLSAPCTARKPFR